MSPSVRYSVLGIFITVSLFGFWNREANASSVTVTAIVSQNCGNGIIDPGELCDGSNLGGASCQSLGQGQGNLVCGANCLFDTSVCSATPPSTPPASPPPTSSSGSTPGTPSNSTAAAIFSGRSYPKSTVTLLKDSAVLAKVIAGSDGSFQISVGGLSGGNYLFSLYSEDEKGNRSSLVNFPTLVSPGVTVKISGIFIAPTISLDKEEVRSGDTIIISGKSSPTTDVLITLNSDQQINVKAKTDEDGLYVYTYDTDLLEAGDHSVKARSNLNGELSPYGKSAIFRVGDRNITAKKTSSLKADFGGDGHVNLADFSVLAYWYKRPSPPSRFDLNGDGKVNLVDFSILAFYWTG